MTTATPKPGNAGVVSDGPANDDDIATMLRQLGDDTFAGFARFSTIPVSVLRALLTELQQHRAALAQQPGSGAIAQGEVRAWEWVDDYGAPQVDLDRPPLRPEATPLYAHPDTRSEGVTEADDADEFTEAEALVNQMRGALSRVDADGQVEVSASYLERAIAALSVKPTPAEETREPTHWAVYSRTGMHIGLWDSPVTAREAAIEYGTQPIPMLALSTKEPRDDQ